ncbi:hypothetical protein BACUNI_03103 [Bacteroides uniformis ATCC 8492]|uniref:Uncharacterized protein n=1 Tax=Bacteroides uniformis (strain ATCC 8492 / DSM 6597 / CCUG 4942 / CIP 103695 / JCM 5828 / KCTC 5204 / NCTC 13054 / VPI 0061) TaxID=411479 RepID=A0ABC9N8H2_BACUC|nr:hypothetical protein BACUNI_03103 [Bacteroides uniformis ATCC 8492]
MFSKFTYSSRFSAFPAVITKEKGHSTHFFLFLRLGSGKP